MNKRYKLLKELLPLMERFEEENQEDEIDMMSFALWLKESLTTESDPEDAVDSKGESLAKHYGFDLQITAVVGYLFRYAKHYSKKVLKDKVLATIDDYVFLASLIITPGLTKSELIQQHLLEITSGTEILKRLLKQDFIEEYENPEDRRSKRLKITPLGMKVLGEVQEEMMQAAHIVGGDLSLSEKAKLVQLCNKLKKFHDQIHEQDKKSEIATIVGKYMG
ncbi:MAG TPA: type I-B CRISPR-associated protein Cas8b1/Cst1 [Microscillaceae bacterium]|nr:type I-B CRISPR-associated protein Cas8b1/Cst1 [Microscillaceae bacterium]